MKRQVAARHWPSTGRIAAHRTHTTAAAFAAVNTAHTVADIVAGIVVAAGELPTAAEDSSFERTRRERSRSPAKLSLCPNGPNANFVALSRSCPHG